MAKGTAPDAGTRSRGDLEHPSRPHSLGGVLACVRSCWGVPCWSEYTDTDHSSHSPKKQVSMTSMYLIPEYLGASAYAHWVPGKVHLREPIELGGA